MKCTYAGTAATMSSTFFSVRHSAAFCSGVTAAGARGCGAAAAAVVGVERPAGAAPLERGATMGGDGASLLPAVLPGALGALPPAPGAPFLLPLLPLLLSLGLGLGSGVR